MDWKEYKGWCRHYDIRPESAQRDLPDGYKPTELECGKKYLVCTDNGVIKVKKWRGKSDEYWGFGDLPTCNDRNVIYYAEIELPKGFANEHQKREIQKLKERIAKMQEKLETLEGE